MGGDEVNAFLTHLAVAENVAASTQNQALSAILFLYREVLLQELDLNLDAVRAKRPRRLPTVLTVKEVRVVLQKMDGVSQLVAKLLWRSSSSICIREKISQRAQRMDLAICISNQ